ncbi:minichromosome maintenance protein MCM [Candidatus Woesearchaeota archaeon]|nr:minichromosome maintenance protein MCM [Nanoarchaeota archaeon]MCB9370067.1 minichromosome maintenance protein MCM [Candidatus Woesearchaeota archaeon]USN44597.1 MAG: minichromosome maintenance protein MCM [Candidatus Woesearchaeota archaeon]
MELYDTKTLIKKFHGFFEEFMHSDIKKVISSGKPALHVDFFQLSEYDLELGDYVLSHPLDAFMLMEQTLAQIAEGEGEHIQPIRVRLSSLPESERVMIRDIRSEHLGKLVLVEGQVRRKTDVRPRLEYLEYLCTNPSCSYSQDKLKLPQSEEKTRTLKNCPKCKSMIELVNKILVDSQTLILEEVPEHLENQGDQPKRINILLQRDLVSPFKDSRTNPGSRVFVIGIVKEIPLQTRTGADSINYDLLIEGNFIDLSEEDYSEIVVTKEDEDAIKELSAKDDVVEILVKNTAPSIYGNNRIKEAVLLQLFGGSGAIKGDGIKTRGDIHMLLIGDPGAAKSQLLKSASKISPKSMFVSGKSATGTGLTATVVKDDLTKGWALEAGAIVLASGGLCAIDELDKMSDEDTSAMHEALEQQTISIAKANIRATLRCETTVLGAANPKFGRFDPYGDIAKQINFPPALISRFDLIFVLRDNADKKKDSLIADHILQTHRDKSKTITEITPDFLKKYIAYAKRLKPVLSLEAIERIKNFYVSIRNAAAENDEGKGSVPITARQLEAIVRLSEAYAKIKLNTVVTEEYAQKAIDMMMYCLEKIGVDPKTGAMDIDRLTTGVTASTRNMYRNVLEIIEKLETQVSEITLELILAEAEKMKIGKIDVNKVLDKLKNEGLIFEPRKNVFKKLA